MEQVDSRFKKSVFISHASKNHKLADEVREGLEKHRVSCWIAPRDIPPGYQYGTAIVEALRDCTITLLVLTDEANMSKAVENEVECAFRYQKVIVPLRIRDVKPATGLEFFVSNAQWVDAIKSPLKSRIEQIVNIVHAIEMGKPVPVPMPEKRTLMGTVERFLEQAFRHKMIAAISGFVILALLSGTGLYMQSQTHWDMSGINTKLDRVKLETSSDPRKELANLGVEWTADAMERAVHLDDVKAFTLFLEGGMPISPRIVDIALSRDTAKILQLITKHRNLIEKTFVTGAVEGFSQSVYVENLSLADMKKMRGMSDSALELLRAVFSDKDAQHLLVKEYHESMQRNDEYVNKYKQAIAIRSSLSACLEFELRNEGRDLVNEAVKFNIFKTLTLSGRSHMLLEVRDYVLSSEGHYEVVGLRKIVEPHCVVSDLNIAPATSRNVAEEKWQFVFELLGVDMN